LVIGRVETAGGVQAGTDGRPARTTALENAGRSQRIFHSSNTLAFLVFGGESSGERRRVSKGCAAVQSLVDVGGSGERRLASKFCVNLRVSAVDRLKNKICVHLRVSAVDSPKIKICVNLRPSAV
jgi:hypothetical protein